MRLGGYDCSRGKCQLGKVGLQVRVALQDRRRDRWEHRTKAPNEAWRASVPVRRFGSGPAFVHSLRQRAGSTKFNTVLDSGTNLHRFSQTLSCRLQRSFRKVQNPVNQGPSCLPD